METLSNKQKNIIWDIWDRGGTPKDSCDVHGNTINFLSKKGYIKFTLYANGDFIELTDKGIDLIHHINYRRD